MSRLAAFASWGSCIPRVKHKVPGSLPKKGSKGNWAEHDSKETQIHATPALATWAKLKSMGCFPNPQSSLFFPLLLANAPPSTKASVNNTEKLIGFQHQPAFNSSWPELCGLLVLLYGLSLAWSPADSENFMGSQQHKAQKTHEQSRTCSSSTGLAHLW